MDPRRLGPLLLTLAGLQLAAPTTATAASWGWPLAPRPAVAARFVAPAGPYAPGHRGVDLVAAAGAWVLAPAAGTVAFVGRVAGRGVVSVDHPGGLRTTYQPVAARVSRGEPVDRGAVLGLLEPGPSHCPPVTCLHWGLRRGTTYLDPLALLGGVRVRLLPVWPLDGPLVRAGRAGPRRAGGSRPARCRPAPRPARSPDPPTT